MRDPGLEYPRTDPLMDLLRKESRFQAVMRELKFDPEATLQSINSCPSEGNRPTLDIGHTTASRTHALVIPDRMTGEMKMNLPR